MKTEQEMLQFLTETNEVTAEHFRESLNLTDDWVYRDIRWLSEEYWNKLLKVLGEDNYRIIIWSTKYFKDGTLGYGGQFMISGQGIQNLLEYGKKNGSE